MSTLPRAWHTAGTNAQLWGARGTYTRIAYEDLPPIDRSRHDGSLGWLAECPEIYGMQYGHDDDNQPEDEEIVECADAIVMAAKAEGFVVPKAFETFMTQPDLFRRVPTCTACYVEAPSELVTVDGLPGRLLRFMNDQQCVLVWCLHLRPDGGHSVVAARPRFSDEAKGDTLEEVATFENIVHCADDFEEFVHRFWLENVLWEVANNPRPLSDEEAAYLAHARRSRGLE